MSRETGGRGPAGREGGGLPAALLLLLGYAVAGLAVRGMSVLRLPLAPHRPWIGLLLGLAEDAGIAATILLLATPLGLLGERLVAALLVGLFALQVLWSEAVDYFGYAPTRQDLKLAAEVGFLGSSFEPSVLARALFFAAIAGGVTVALRATRSKGRRPGAATRQAASSPSSRSSSPCSRSAWAGSWRRTAPTATRWSRPDASSPPGRRTP